MKKTPGKTLRKLIVDVLVLSMVFILINSPSNTVIYADSVSTDISFGDSNNIDEEIKENNSSRNDKEDIVILEEDSLDDINLGLDGISEDDKNHSLLDENVEQHLNNKEIEFGDSNEKVTDSSEIEELNSHDSKSLDTLENNEVIVSGADELRVLIESSGGIDNNNVFYLSSDITMPGILIPKGYSFTIDGTNPETGTRHKIIESSQSTWFNTNLYYPTNTNSSDITYTIKNVDLQGTSKEGLVRSKYLGINLQYINVNYSGPQISNGLYENLVIEDSVINHRSSVNPVVNSKNLKLIGTNKIVPTSPINRVFAIQNSINFGEGSTTIIKSEGALVSKPDGTATGSMIIEKGATVEQSKPVFNNNLLIDSSIVVNTFENNGTLTIKTDKVTKYVVRANSSFMNRGIMNLHVKDVGASVIRPYLIFGFATVDGGTIDIDANKVGSIFDTVSINFINNALLNIKVNVQTGKVLISARDNFQVEDSIVNIKVNDSSTIEKTAIFYTNSMGSRIDFINSIVKVDINSTRYREIFQTNSFSFISNEDSDSLFLFTSTRPQPRLFYPYSGNRVNIETSQINLWTNKAEFTNFPDNRMNATTRVAFKDNRLIKMSFGTDSPNKITSNVTGTDFDSVNQIDFTGKRIIAMGNIPMSNTINKSASNQIIFDTSSDAWVNFRIDPSIEVYSDYKGHVSHQIPENLENGEYPVDVYSNYLFREDKLIYDAEGILEIVSVTESLEFGTVQLKETSEIYERSQEMKISIADGRHNKSGWKLSVYLESPLQIEGNSNSILSNALVFKDSNNRTLSSTPLLVYETNKGDYEEITEISWSKNEGIQLFIESYTSVLVQEQYNAKLVWVLEEK